MVVHRSLTGLIADIMTARLLVYEAARRMDNHQPFVEIAAMAKLRSSEVAGSVATRAVEWLGGVGFTREYDAEKYYR